MNILNLFLTLFIDIDIDILIFIQLLEGFRIRVLGIQNYSGFKTHMHGILSQDCPVS